MRSPAAPSRRSPRSARHRRGQSSGCSSARSDGATCSSGLRAIVGEPADETRARDDRVRREKRRAVRQNVDPEAKERKRAATAFARHELAPALRRAGFDDAAGRTFWRSLDDRVELLHCKAHRGGLTLELGIWFRFVPRPHAVPEHDGRLRPGLAQCDVRGNVHASHDDLSSAGRTSGLWFAAWRPLRSCSAGSSTAPPRRKPSAGERPAPPGTRVLTGYVAREAGERLTARKQLRPVARAYRNDLEQRRVERPAEVTHEWEAWVAQLQADADAT